MNINGNQETVMTTSGSFHEIKTQVLLPPKLTVNPPVIKNTDSVTLSCQTPSSVSQCYFRIIKGGLVESFTCQKTLTGTELLQMISPHTSSAEVEVMLEVICSYFVKLGETNSLSPPSDRSSITILIRPAPKLTVNPSMITETDSVTLNCQTPSSVKVSQCYFNIVGQKTTTRPFSCQKTMTGMDLQRMAGQRSPAEIEVKCFYTQNVYPSPHSDTSSVTIQHGQKPQMTLQYFPGDEVLFTCSLPGSVNVDTRCNLYFGEARHPALTTVVRKESTKNNQRFCQFFVRIDFLLSHLRLVQQSEASCDYSLGSEHDSLSPRSDGSSLTDIVKKESSTVSTQSAFTTTEKVESRMMQTKPIFTITTGLTVGSSTTGRFTSLTSVKTASDETSLHEASTEASSVPVPTQSPASEKKMILMTGAIVTVAVVLLGFALLSAQSRIEYCVTKRPKANITGDREYMGGYDETYSIVTYESNTEDNSSSSEKLHERSSVQTSRVYL